jgi:YegS/Rv2252/BmrU family lipid kinase
MHKVEALKILFVINPISGGKEKGDWEAGIRQYFKEKPHTIEIFLLTGEGDERSVRHHIAQVKPDRIVAVGGDGTVKLVAGVVKETPLPLGIIPAGSANGMAKELDLPQDLIGALDVITTGEVRKVDAIRINEEELCLHLSDVGMNAMLVKYFDEAPGRGMWTYAKGLLKVLWRKRKLRLTLETDEGEMKCQAYMVVLANARKYGTGANINPEGDVADGKFEVVILRKLNLFEIYKAIFTNRPFHPEKIEVVSTRTAKIFIHRKAWFQIDGEYKGKVSQVTARILPGVLQMILPKATSGVA